MWYEPSPNINPNDIIAMMVIGIVGVLQGTLCIVAGCSKNRFVRLTLTGRKSVGTATVSYPYHVHQETEAAVGPQGKPDGPGGGLLVRPLPGGAAIRDHLFCLVQTLEHAPHVVRSHQYGSPAAAARLGSSDILFQEFSGEIWQDIHV